MCCIANLHRQAHRSGKPSQQGQLLLTQCACAGVLLSRCLLQGSKSWNKINERVAWARRYARINALALRKIAKKHDKLMHSRTGHLFLQVGHFCHDLP